MSWAERPTAHVMPDGRLRLINGPIDLVVSAQGPRDAVQAAHRRARDAFAPVLADLAAELARLRQPLGDMPDGKVARAMARAVRPFAPAFVTPMAAVAGAVADHVLGAMLTEGHSLASAHVNNGGDIALWTGGPVLRVGICEDPLHASPGARAEIRPADGIGGVATSGWKGRSHSFGIADAVTVLARSAAEADAAATLIANAVDVPGHPAIKRAPADSLSPDSDLGARQVTINVGLLPLADVRAALDRAENVARDYAQRGLIVAACLACQGQRRMIGATALDTATIARRPIKEPIHA